MGRAELLRDSLSSLVQGLRETDQLIVSEAGGAAAASILDGLRPAPAELVHLRVDPPGKCRQLNHAILAASGEVLLLTDDDVRVPSDWAEAMVTPFQDPGIGLACGRVRGLSRVPGTEQDSGPPPGEAPFEPWRFAHGAAMAVRRSAALQAGGFDERLGPGTPACGEDHDFVLRVRSGGWRIAITAGEAVEHMDWRSSDENVSNALAYEKGGGAVVGAALRRSARDGFPVFRRRMRYQRDVFRWNPRFGPSALGAFTAGLVYGLQLEPRDWFESPIAGRQ